MESDSQSREVVSEQQVRKGRRWGTALCAERRNGRTISGKKDRDKFLRGPGGKLSFGRLIEVQLGEQKKVNKGKK